MSNKIHQYELSYKADLDAVFDYIKNKYGFNRRAIAKGLISPMLASRNFIEAVKYLTDIDTIFNALIENPNIGRARNEIKKELFSIAEQKHVIFYRISNDYIRIVRVLHGSKDISKSFGNK